MSPKKQKQSNGSTRRSRVAPNSLSADAPLVVQKDIEQPVIESIAEVKLKQHDLEVIEQLDSKLNNFIEMTSKSKVAVIVPLFGYWSSVKDNPLNLEMLSYVLDRIQSQVHDLYIILVAEDSRLPTNIIQALKARVFAGNVMGVKVTSPACYSDYLNEGLYCALNDTQAAYICVLNPWIAIQHNAIDAIVNRVNRSDAKLVSGYDVTDEIENEKFNTAIYDAPKELRDLDLNFVAMTRQFAEVINLDPSIKTHDYVTKDILQYMFVRGYDSITSQRIPTFSFKVNWSTMENEDDYVQDRINFIKKWGFDPDVE